MNRPIVGHDERGLLFMEQIKYLTLPIYSVAVFKEFIYFSGGGGGSTGIPNQIKVYHKTITSEPANSIPTQQHIIENLTVDENNGRVVASANDYVVVFGVEQAGRQLEERQRFRADFKPHYPTINAICLSADGGVVVTGGDDTTVRFFKIGDGMECTLLHEYSVHSHPIKAVDCNQDDLFLSCDSHLVAVCNLSRKQIVRRVFQDQLQPARTLFQAAYFQEKANNSLLFVHYLVKEKTFVTREQAGRFHTKEVAQDQCCKSAYHRGHRSLGVAGGRGATTMWDCKAMRGLGTHKNHKEVVLGCTVTRKNCFVTGTSACSYHVQPPTTTFSLNWSLLLALLWTGLTVFLLGSTSSSPDSFEL